MGAFRDVELDDAMRRLRDLEILNASRAEKGEARTEDLEQLYEISKALPPGPERSAMQANNLLARTVESMGKSQRDLLEAVTVMQIVVVALTEKVAALEGRLEDG